MNICLGLLPLAATIILGVACSGDTITSEGLSTATEPTPQSLEAPSSPISLGAGEKHFNAGLALQEQGRIEQAITEYNEAIRLEPQNTGAFVNRGNAYAGLGQHQRAINDYDEAIRLDPDLAVAYSNRGRSYLELSEPRRAMQDLDEAIRLDPEFALAYSKLGNALEALDQRDEAIRAYSQAISLHPLFETYNNRGLLYSKSGEQERAIEDYGEAIRLEPGHSDIFIQRGLANYILGRFHLSIQDYDEAIRLDDRNPQAYRSRVMAYIMLGMDTDAEQDVDRAVELGMNQMELEGLIELLKASYDGELSVIQTAVDSFFTAPNNSRYLGLRQYPIRGSNSGTGDRSAEVLNTYVRTDSGADLPTPITPLRGSGGGDPRWRDDGDGIRNEDNLNAEAESEGGGGSGWSVGKVNVQGTDYVVDTRDYFIDFTLLLDAGILLSVPPSASLDNSGGTSAGPFSWYVEATGLVKSLYYHLPEVKIGRACPICG